ncbi:hypothetical protein GGI15_002288 [Coemansia interrupta]|uniref:Glutathione S-transferase n=1 Tax=Coemansia interrupta TaxID=1126814 RepID=A0A9W8HKI4_9FUNG|nr:hypothetical protein GGI15_002288 [Coemansia interrupta]
MSSTSNTLSYVIRYFSPNGLAEVSRMMLSAAGVECVLEIPEWPQEKPNQPFGRLPVLIEKNADGEVEMVLSESATIERYIARTYGFVPTGPKQDVYQEQFCDQTRDVVIAFYNRLTAKPEAQEETISKFDYLLDLYYRVHSEQLRKNGDNGHYFGDKLTYVDFAAYNFFKHMCLQASKHDEAVRSQVLSKITPEFAKLIKTVESDPVFKSYVTENGEVASLVE